MAQGIYRGVSNVARKVSSIYRGVSNVARKVSKGYRGVNNIARQFYSSQETITQTGSEYFVWSGTSDGSAYITFPKPFLETPTVTFTTKYDNGPHHSNLRVMSKSKTQFRLYAEHAGERGTYSRFRVNWTATGLAET